MSPWWSQVFTISAGVFPPLAVISAFFVWVVKAIIRKENVHQTKEIAATYVPSMKSNLTGAEIGRAIVTLQEDMADMDASRKRHDERNRELIATLSREVDRLKLTALNE